MQAERWIYKLPLRLRSLLHRQKADEELDDELRDHLELKTQQYVSQGLAPQVARRAAVLEMGGIEKRKEECRDARGTHFLETFIQDLRYGFRMLRKSPGFAAIAIITLALGIGANTAIFSYVNAWLIKPLPFPQADRLMVLLSHDTKKGLSGNGVTSSADFFDYEKQNSSFEQLVPWTGWDFNLTGDGPPDRILGGLVGWNFFQ